MKNQQDFLKAHIYKTLRMKPGSKLVVENGDGTESEIDLVELAQLDEPENKVVFKDDFLAGAIDDRISSTAGSGTGNEALTVVANSVSGEATLTSASDDGNHAANCTSATLDQLNFKANQGGLYMETRVKIDDVSEAVLFVGFTDVISSTVELPIYLTGADAIDSDATNACGVIYDVDAATDEFAHGGVKADADTDPAFSGESPSDGVYVKIRVEVNEDGGVQGYINDVAIPGGEIADAVTVTTTLTPCVVIGNRSANQVVATLDYIEAGQNR